MKSPLFFEIVSGYGPISYRNPDEWKTGKTVIALIGKGIPDPEHGFIGIHGW